MDGWMFLRLGWFWFRTGSSSRRWNMQQRYGSVPAHGKNKDDRGCACSPALTFWILWFPHLLRRFLAYLLRRARARFFVILYPPLLRRSLREPRCAALFHRAPARAPLRFNRYRAFRVTLRAFARSAFSRAPMRARRARTLLRKHFTYIHFTRARARACGGSRALPRSPDARTRLYSRAIAAPLSHIAHALWRARASRSVGCAAQVYFARARAAHSLFNASASILL